MDDKVDAIIAGFYEAGAGAISWGQALETLREAVDAWLVLIQGIDFAKGVVTFSHEAGDCSPESVVDYLRTWHRVDPRNPVMLSVGIGEWVHCHEVFDDEFVANDPFFQEFLIPYGGRYVSGTRLIQDGQELVMLGVHRGRHQQPLGPDEVTLCQRISPHLIEALRIYRAQRQVAAQVVLGHELLGRIRAPIVLLDEQRQLHYANASARTIIAEDQTLQLRGGLLGCASPDAESALLLALRQLGLGGDSCILPGPPADKAFVRVPDAGGKHPAGVYLYAVLENPAFDRRAALEKVELPFWVGGCPTRADPCRSAQRRVRPYTEVGSGH